MTIFRSVLAATALAGGLLIGVGSAVGSAQPAPPPPALGEPVPAWAPKKPADMWLGQPVVWNSGWGGRWGVWINGAFMILSSNPVTNGG
jgi:hypothetical protein